MILGSEDSGQAYRDMRRRFGLPESSYHSVVVTTAPGLRKAIQANWPLAAEPNIAAGLASKIQDFLDDRFDIKALSRRLIECSRNSFSHEHMVAEYEQAYAEYLGRACSGRDTLAA